MILVMIIVGLILWCSVCEWLLHRYVMHKVPFGFEYAYKAHTKVHHSIYKCDDSYHAQDGDDGKKIPMIPDSTDKMYIFNASNNISCTLFFDDSRSMTMSSTVLRARIG